MTAQDFQKALEQANAEQKRKLLALQDQLYKMIEKFESLGVDPEVLKGRYNTEKVRNEIEEIGKEAMSAFWRRKDVQEAIRDVLGDHAT
ncbi:MAG: hypothetical protein H6727_13840 [Myxococcales bacterium]|nr:hypothetical protein [Myxococcales bacterium]